MATKFKSKMSRYSTFKKMEGFVPDKKDEEDIRRKCPKCNQRAQTECDCMNYCRKCANGHIWYIDRYGDGDRKLGDPHKLPLSTTPHGKGAQGSFRL